MEWAPCPLASFTDVRGLEYGHVLMLFNDAKSAR